MKFPFRKLKIGAHTFTVKIEDSGLLEDGSHGICKYDDNTIAVSSDLSDSQMVKTLWHEILHALNNELSEKEVEWLAEGITQVMLDNELYFIRTENKVKIKKK